MPTQLTPPATHLSSNEHSTTSQVAQLFQIPRVPRTNRSLRDSDSSGPSSPDETAADPAILTQPSTPSHEPTPSSSRITPSNTTITARESLVASWMNDHWWKVLLVATVGLMGYAIASVFFPPLLFGLPVVTKASGLLISAGLSASSPALLPMCAILFATGIALLGACCFAAIAVGKKWVHSHGGESKITQSSTSTTYLTLTSQSFASVTSTPTTHQQQDKCSMPPQCPNFGLLESLCNSLMSYKDLAQNKLGISRRTSSYQSFKDTPPPSPYVSPVKKPRQSNTAPLPSALPLVSSIAPFNI
jgi:hypothetical protein